MLAGDPLDDADRDALVLEDRALLDVELEIGLERRAGPCGRQDAVGREVRPLQDVAEGHAEGGPAVPDLVLVEKPHEGPAAQEIADEIPFLVRERGDLERPSRAGPSPRRIRRAASSAASDARRAVEHAAVGDRVDVRAGHDGLPGALEAAELVARAVLAVAEAGVLDLLPEPGPGFEVGRAERGPADPAVLVPADAAELLEVALSGGRC